MPQPSVTTTPLPEPEHAPSPWAVAGLGVQFALGLVVGVTAGKWLDPRLHTGAPGVFLGALVGGGGTFYLGYRRLMQPFGGLPPAPSATSRSTRSSAAHPTDSSSGL